MAHPELAQLPTEDFEGANRDLQPRPLTISSFVNEIVTIAGHARCKIGTALSPLLQRARPRSRTPSPDTREVGADITAVDCGREWAFTDCRKKEPHAKKAGGFWSCLKLGFRGGWG
jgi:hypothetical protein